VVFHKRTLRELLLAAGLWLTASASLAAPQPAPNMPLGDTALPPRGYVAFCERKPQDCGADTGVVLARAYRADAERAELLAALGPQMPAVIMPAAVGASDGPTRPARVTAANWIDPAQAARLPVAAAETAGVVRAEVVTQVAFIDPVAQVEVEREARTPSMTPRLWSLLNRVNADINGAIEERTDSANYGVDDFWNTPLEDGRHAGDCEDYVLEKERALLNAGVPRAALNIALVTTRWGESHAVLLVDTSQGEYVLDNLSPWIVTWREAPYRWNRRQLNGDPFSWAMVGDPARHRDDASQRLLIASNR